MRIAVISPFLDRQHGTERCLIEQLERFPVDAGAEIHIYSQQIHDLRGVVEYKAAQTPQPPGTYLFWHKVPSIPGPHILQYAFWFFANKLCRWRDHKFHGLKYDLVYSPGINATDADAIAVHIVFHEFYRQVRSEIGFQTSPVKKWPLLLHRRIYYRVIMALENRVYRQEGVSLAAVSDLVAQQLKKYFQSKNVRIIRNGVDAESLSISARLAKRGAARKHFQLSETDFALLLIGNDWKKKGLNALLGALADMRDLPWKLLVVGSDERGGYEKVLRDTGMMDRVSFLTPSPDVLQFYAAADAYVGPSLEDAYGLPVLEAMACGLPVLSSSRAGVSEIIVHGKNGLVLQDPRDTKEIATALQSLISSPALCQQLGEQAALTAQSNTWARNAQAAWDWLSEALRQKNSSPDTGEQAAVAGAAARSANST